MAFRNIWGANKGNQTFGNSASISKTEKLRTIDIISKRSRGSVSINNHRSCSAKPARRQKPNNHAETLLRIRERKQQENYQETASERTAFI